MKNKTEKYYSEARPELLKFYPISIKKLLDVGCSSANFSGALKSRSDSEVWGIEMNVEAATEAAKKIDKVLVGDMCEIVKTLPKDYFDCIGCNDILEHIYDPWQILKDIKGSLTADGVIVASIPNFLVISNLYPLLFKKEWDYKDEGTLDFTHIRFFTKKSIIKMFQQCGYEIIKIEGINPEQGWKWKVLNVITFGLLFEFSFLQFVCVAKPLKL